MKTRDTTRRSDGSTSTPDRVLALVLDALAADDQAPGGDDLLPHDDIGRIARNVRLTIHRRRPSLEWILARCADRPVKARLRRVLLWGLVELLYLDGMPAAAVADTAVRYVKRRFNPAEAGFVNAVLRRVSRDGRALVEALDRDAPPHVRLNLGEPLYRRWSKRFDGAELQALADALQEPAPLTVRSRGESPALPYLEPIIEPEVPEIRGLFRCTDPEAFFRSEAYGRGDFYVQDPATLLAPALAEVHAGECVADLCAAPGGKALLLADAVGEAGVVLAMDVSPRRLARLVENATGVPACRILVGDACRPPLRPASVDVVFLDVPCSNTGVIRRRPDVRRNFSEAGLRELVGMQAAMLDAAARLVRSGGRIVYSTCSLEPEEDGMQATAFLGRHTGFRKTHERLLLPGPCRDGAYAAVLQAD